ncbi:MAG: rod shape-determining protein [Coriobacteriia bacterium]|jgi:rod shape-determining protein MreB|nr:rod shape-determining protein [Coriobacteriia bacterium]MDR2714558.1 rod shape-determining protein [Coriobacteriales bacterium]
MSFLDNVFSQWSCDMAIDLGTANTLVAVAGEGVVLNEPSVVAVDTEVNRVISVGSEAREMIGRNPGNISVERPLSDGVIADYDVTEAMLSYFINKANPKTRVWQPKPRIVICIPCGVTSVEKRAVFEATIQAGARQAFLLEEPMAAAIGAGLPVEEPTGSMVIDVGGGTTEIAVISLGGIVASRSLRIAGNEFDEAIARHIRDVYGLNVGVRTAEDIKIGIGSAMPIASGELDMEISGRDLATNLPRSELIQSEDVRDGLRGPLHDVLIAIKETFLETDPDLAADIITNGILLTGGGGLLKMFDGFLTRELEVPVYISDTAFINVVMGCLMALENPDALQRSYTQR